MRVTVYKRGGAFLLFLTIILISDASRCAAPPDKCASQMKNLSLSNAFLQYSLEAFAENRLATLSDGEQTLSIRLSPKLKERLDVLSSVTKLTKAELVERGAALLWNLHQDTSMLKSYEPRRDMRNLSLPQAKEELARRMSDTRDFEEAEITFSFRLAPSDYALLETLSKNYGRTLQDILHILVDFTEAMVWSSTSIGDEVAQGLINVSRVPKAKVRVSLSARAPRELRNKINFLARALNINGNDVIVGAIKMAGVYLERASDVASK